MSYLVLLTLACTGTSTPSPLASDDTDAPVEAPPTATDPDYWDTSPDTGWMADLPTYPCPTPDADDTAIELDSRSLLFQLFNGRDGDPDLLMAYSGVTGRTLEGTEGCQFLDDELDWIKGGWEEAGSEEFSGRFWERSFAPGMLEGVHTFPDSSWDHRATIGVVRDGVGAVNQRVWRPLLIPKAPRGSAGDTPYQDVCFVRVRPHRVVGVWRIQAPPKVFAANRWPVDLHGGLFVKWDIRWGIGDNEANWLGCFFDDYIDVDPQEIWPGWPDGWEPADTVPKEYQR